MTTCGCAPFVRKQVGQLPSKMRYVAAQFAALLADDLWLTNAGHANAMARRLHDATADLPGLDLARPAVNSLFPILSNGTQGLLDIDPNLLDLFRINNSTRWQVLVKLRFPSAVPGILAAPPPPLEAAIRTVAYAMQWRIPFFPGRRESIGLCPVPGCRL